MILIYTLLPTIIPILIFYYCRIFIDMFLSKEMDKKDFVAWLPLGLVFRFIYKAIKEELDERLHTKRT